MTPYATTTDADTYLAERLFADAWEDASDLDKERALGMATRKIERLPLRGWKKDVSQELEFPRCYRNPPVLGGSSAVPLGGYCEDEVPQAVKDACCEEALALLERGNSNRAKRQREGVTSFSLGDLSESYGEAAEYSGRKLLSYEACELLRPYQSGPVAVL